MPDDNVRFCAYPYAFIYHEAVPKEGQNIKKHLFWGDTVCLLEKKDNTWFKVHSRGEDGWMKATDLQKDPLLDIVFLDVGQGDSCLIVTPKDELIIVDAGLEDNLVRYMRWRYNNYDSPEMKAMGGDIRSIVISHPDADHYLGLKSLFDPQRLGAPLKVKTIFHNGIFPLKGKAIGTLGSIKKIKKTSYLSGQITDDDSLEAFFAATPADRLDEFSGLMREIKDQNPDVEFRMLNCRSRGNEIFGNVKDLSVKILGPVVTDGPGGAVMLNTFGGEKGVAKNGNSLIFTLRYKNVSILFFGDVNAKAGKQLFAFYKDTPGVFKADVYKVSHHGSNDFYDDLIRCVNPRVSVISSGDNEGYSHPRADTLGYLGKVGRGDRPLVFSTELGRSYIAQKETGPAVVALAGNAATPPGPTAPAAAEPDAALEKAANRLVAIYGAINLRTDGEKLLLCQKKEAPDPQHREWDLYLLEPDKKKEELVMVPAGKAKKKAAK